MKPDYKNWMPKGMVHAFLFAFLGCGVAAATFQLLAEGTLKTVLTFASAVGKVGADFKRQFTLDSYRQFFLDAGYGDVRITLAEGHIPCAVAVMTKKRDGGNRA